MNGLDTPENLLETLPLPDRIMKKCYLSFLFIFQLTAPLLSQELFAKIDFNSSKQLANDTEVELSFTVNSSNRNDLNASQLSLQLQQDSNITSCFVAIDDIKPKALVIIKINYFSNQEMEHVFKKIFQHLQLSRLVLNENVFVSVDEIHF